MSAVESSPTPTPPDTDYSREWCSVQVGQEANKSAPMEVHSFPLDDLRTHELHGNCWCHPTTETEDWIFYHHALDGREWYDEHPLH